MAAWYCLIDDKEYGPFSSERIHSLVKKGKLTRDHFVRPSTNAQWTAAADIPGLFSAEAPKAASPKTAPPKAKPPKSPPAAKAKPPVATKTHKPPMAAALPATSEDAEIPSALPVAAPIAAPIATPVAAPASLPVGTPVAPSSPAIPAKDPSETIAHVRKKSKQQQYLIAGGLVAVLIVLGGVALFALNRSRNTEPQEDQAAQSKIDQTETPAPAGDVEADPNPETDPPAEEPARKRAGGAKPATLPPISRWLDASRKQGILRFSDSMIRFHVVDAWLDSSESSTPTLTVEITLTNGSSTELLDFRGWTLAGDASINDAVLLADDKDRCLSPSSTSGRVVNRRYTSRRLNPKESVTDQLVFEAPVGEYEQLRLYLPYAAIGRTGHMGFVIPGVMIKDRPPGAEEPIAAAPKPAVTEPATDSAAPKPEVVIQPPKPPKSDDPFSIDVLRNSIEESMDGGQKSKPDSESVPSPSGASEQPKMIDGSRPNADEEDPMEERAEEE